jgi:hypothetical protein
MDRVRIALQLVHDDFDYLFRYKEQRRLWYEFVLPQTAVSYRDMVVINSSNIRTVGLA